MAFAPLMTTNLIQAQTGGFIGQNNSNIGTVAQLKNLPDDTYLLVKGNIVRQIQGDLYEFKDNTGTVKIKVNHKYWNGLYVTSKDTLLLLIEVDKDPMHTEYEVKAPVEFLKASSLRR